MPPTNLTPADIAEVAASASKRLMVQIKAVSEITAKMDLSRPSSLERNAGDAK